MPDSDLGGPGWRERLADVERRTSDGEPLADAVSGVYMFTEHGFLPDIRSALAVAAAASPQEGGGGAGESIVCLDYPDCAREHAGGAGGVPVHPPAGSRISGDEALPWPAAAPPPAGVQVDREALRNAIIGALDGVLLEVNPYAKHRAGAAADKVLAVLTPLLGSPGDGGERR